MTPPEPPPVNWHEWLARWDAQQTGYLPHRERRFETMLDLLAGLLPAEFVAVDLASGPGSLSRRLLSRFPRAQCVAVDLDPVLLEIGRRTSEEMSERLRWVEADLGTADLAAVLDVDQVDAVLSSTALHWLPADQLAGLYSRLGKLIRPGGVLLNADNIPFGRSGNPFQQLADARSRRHASEAFGGDPGGGWRQFWQSVAAEPQLRAASAARERRFATIDRDHPEPVLEFHLAALRNAGFGTVDVVWQEFDDRIVAAVR